MRLEHNSHNGYYRRPFGAVPDGSKVVLRLCVESFSPPENVYVVYNGREMRMSYLTEMCGFRVFEVRIKTTSPQLLWYYFKVTADNQTAYYGDNQSGLGGLGSIYYNVPPRCFQITVFDRNFRTPNWFKKSVVYQIFPDRFFRSGDTKITGIQRNWGDMPFYKAEQFGGKYTSNDFFGGNLHGIVSKLPYLKKLGVNAIYLNPIFEAATNHKYDTGDYEVVDETFGGNQAFDFLISEAENVGIKIILDGVFNHTGSNSKYFNKEGTYPTLGAYQSKQSPYYEWYNFRKFPDDYDCWWGFTTLPHIRELVPSFLRYIVIDEDSIIKYWTRRGAWGWRLDVVDELPDAFVKQIRMALKDANRDAVLIGEVWEDASNKTSYGRQREYMLGRELDSVMNYPFRTAVIEFLCGNFDAWRLHREIMSLKSNYPKEAFYSLLNLVGSHDVMRVLSALSDAPHIPDRENQAQFVLPPARLELGKKRLKLAVFLQCTLPGVPCIYYGDEVGMTGYSDPFNRQCFPWGNEDTELLEWYTHVISLRTQYPALVLGDFQSIYYMENTYGFLRTISGHYDVFENPSENQQLLVLVNSHTQNLANVCLDLGRLNVSYCRDMVSEQIVHVEDGHCSIAVAPLEGKLFTLH